MPKKVKGIIVSRLIILVAVILVPIAIFLIFNLADFQLWFSNDPTLVFWIIKILCPSVFSISWLFFLILFSERFAKTLDSMDKIIGIIPLRLKMFYGAIAVIILFIFVFPVITPFVSILSFASMAWRLTTYRKEDWGESGTPFITKFVMVLAAIPPFFCTMVILPNYLVLARFLQADIWIPLQEIIYKVSYSLCTALAIGTLFILVSNKGVSEYEQMYKDSSKSKSILHIRIIELLLFVFFLILDFQEFAIVDFFYYVGFFIVVLVSIVNYFSGRAQVKKFSSHVFGYLLAAIFMGSNILFVFEPILSQFLRFTSLVVLAAVFILVFFYTFVKVERFEFS